MSIPTYGQPDDFEYKGIWWLPDKPQNKIPGVLTRRRHKTSLELFGGEGYTLPFERVFPGTVPLLHGHIETDDACTLYEVAETQRPTMSGGFRRSIVQSAWSFIGVHFPSPDAIRFSSLDLSFIGLEHWMFDKPIIENEQLRENDRFVGFRSTFRFETPEFIPIPALGCISFSFATSHSQRLTEVGYTSVPYVTLSFNEPKDLQTCYQLMRDCRSLLTLLAGGALPLTHFRGSADTVGYGARVQIFYQDMIIQPSEPIHRVDIPLPLSAVKERMADIVPLWFQKCVSLRTVLNLFVGTYYNQTMFVESQFLSLTQALELYSRLIEAGKYVPEPEYDGIRKAIEVAIREVTRCGLRDALCKRLKYGNEYSLRKRIRGILQGLESDTLAMICGNAKSYTKRIVDTRNYLTHYGSDPDSEPWYDPSEQFFAVQSLQVLLMILVLRDVGVPEQTIREGLSHSNTLSQIVALYLKHLSPTASGSSGPPSSKVS